MSTTFPALDTVEGEISKLQKDLNTVFTEAGDDIDLTKVKHVKGDSRAIAAQIRSWNDELTDKGKAREDLLATLKAAERAKTAGDQNGTGEGGSEGNGGKGSTTASTKTIGQIFIEKGGHKNRESGTGPVVHTDYDVKTLMTTSAGWAPEITRTGVLVPFATRPIQVADVIPTTTTIQTGVRYMEETTFTNAAVETNEAGTYQEATLAYTERTSNVRKIAVFLPMTDEQLEDVTQAQGVIDNRLPFMVRQRLDLQIISGDGAAPNLRGVMNVAGIQTQAKGADPTPDAVYKSIVKVEVTGQAFANLVIMHPLDWQGVRLLRTADGLYIWGNPSDSGPERIWGLGVVRAQAATQGTAIVGDWANFAELSIKRGLDLQVSNSHSTFFIEGKQAVRADMRAALIFYRPVAFCTVTGL
jgi:HK97 family phage major capsid protein